jgi:hypothetical protein
MRDREVDQRHPERNEQGDRRELHAFGEGADDEGGGDRRKRHLEADVDQFRDVDVGGEGRNLSVEDGLAFGCDLQEGLGEAADEVRAAGEGQAVAVQHPDDGDDADGVEHLRQHREHVLGTDQAAIEQRKAGDRHQQHQYRRCHHPGIVALVDGCLGKGRGRGEQADCEGRQSRAIGTFERHLFYS